MAIIEIKKEDKEKAFDILIKNGLFRALGENKFDIVENPEEVFKKLKKVGVKFEVIKQ